MQCNEDFFDFPTEPAFPSFDEINAYYNSQTWSHRPTIEMDCVAAAWLLFQFNRQSKEQKASHTIRTLLPTGELKVVHIEVECLMMKQIGEDRFVPAGLPGAFAQDIFIGLMDRLVHQIQTNHADVASRAQTIGLKGFNLPTSCTEVYFRNKDLANRMQMSENNSRITEALEHLHKTHVTIRGCIYRDGKEESLVHDSYYIPMLTAGKRLRGGMEKTEWQRAKFDEVLVREILHGYIAQMDTDKLLRLPSGAPRKLYSLLAAKMIEGRGAKNIVITSDEIINMLRIKKSVYKKAARKYFQNLVDASIVNAYTFAEHRGIDVVVFEVPPSQKKKAITSDIDLAENFFEMAHEVAKKDHLLALLLQQPNLCDLDATNLASLKRNNPEEVLFEGKYYSKAILWADMLLYNRSRGQYIKSIVPLLKTLLKKNQEPTVAYGFVPIDVRLRKIEVVIEAKRSVEESQKVTEAENEKVRETALHSWKKYSDSQRERIKQAVQESLFGTSTTTTSSWQPQPKFYEFRAIELIESAINHGLPTSDVTGMLRWYREHSRNS